MNYPAAITRNIKIIINRIKKEEDETTQDDNENNEEISDDEYVDLVENDTDEKRIKEAIPVEQLKFLLDNQAQRLLKAIDKQRTTSPLDEISKRFEMLLKEFELYKEKTEIRILKLEQKLETTKRIERIDTNIQMEQLSSTKNAKDWFNKFEKYASINNWVQDEMNDRIYFWLKNEAKDIFDNLEESNRTYMAFKTKVLTQRTKMVNPHVCMTNLISCQQGLNESLDEFARRFNKIATELATVQELPENNRINYFRMGTRPEIRSYLAQLKVSTLEQLINKGVEYEQNLGLYNKNENNINLIAIKNNNEEQIKINNVQQYQKYYSKPKIQATKPFSQHDFYKRNNDTTRYNTQRPFNKTNHTSRFRNLRNNRLDNNNSIHRSRSNSYNNRTSSNESKYNRNSSRENYSTTNKTSRNNSPNRKQIICYHCKKIGHVESECRKKMHENLRPKINLN